MTIYEVRKQVWKYNRKGNREWIEDHEVIYLDNSENALATYNDWQRSINIQYASLAGYGGRCQLFIPEVLENGMLAYYPSGEYIEKYEF
jgi:hypothetical protein